MRLVCFVSLSFATCMGLEQHAAFDITTARSTPSAGNLVGSPAFNAQQVLDRGFPVCGQYYVVMQLDRVYVRRLLVVHCFLAGSLTFIVIRRHVSISA